MCVGSPKPVLPPRLGVLGMEGRQAWNGLKERKEEEGGREGIFPESFPLLPPYVFLYSAAGYGRSHAGGDRGKGDVSCTILRCTVRTHTHV